MTDENQRGENVIIQLSAPRVVSVTDSSRLVPLQLKHVNPEWINGQERLDAQ